MGIKIRCLSHWREATHILALSIQDPLSKPTPSLFRPRKRHRSIMVGRRFNNRRGPRPAPRNNARALVRRAQHSDGGHKIVPALRPPQIVRLPWNSFTFSATYSTASSAEITVSIGSIPRNNRPEGRFSLRMEHCGWTQLYSALDGGV